MVKTGVKWWQRKCKRKGLVILLKKEPIGSADYTLEIKEKKESKMRPKFLA